MKKNKLTSEGVTKASIRTRIHAIQKDMIDYLTRHTVKEALNADQVPISEWNP